MFLKLLKNIRKRFHFLILAVVVMVYVIRLDFKISEVKQNVLLSSMDSKAIQYTNEIERISPTNFDTKNTKRKRSNKKAIDSESHVQEHLRSSARKLQSIYKEDNKQMPGENGTAVFLNTSMLTKAEKDKITDAMDKYGFNTVISDMISLNRTLPPFHLKARCNQLFDRNLFAGKTSVITVCYNEPWSLILRTVHSVLNRTPASLLEEIIIVDDYSTEEHIITDLPEYVDKLEKVKVLRLNKRRGLIEARNHGAKNAKGTYLVVIDCHCEATEDWLQPLLTTLIKNPKTLALPTTDDIFGDTFKFVPVGSIICGFGWNLIMIWLRHNKKLANPTDAIPSPGMVGNMFAIRKDFYFHIGGFDPGLRIWGAENVELPIKVWMCGGRVEQIPCSRIGHVYRKMKYIPQREKNRKKPKPHELYEDPGIQNGEMSFINRNRYRVAKVWLDDYFPYFDEISGFVKGSYGNITDQLRKKKELKCKSFEWYLDNVYPLLGNPKRALYRGRIDIKEKIQRGNTSISLSIQTNKTHHIFLGRSATSGRWYYYQYWLLTPDGKIQHDVFCLSVHKDNTQIQLKTCEPNIQISFWKLRSNNNIELIEKSSSSKKKRRRCLTGIPKENKVLLQPCRKNDPMQTWKFQFKNKEHLD